MFSRLFWGLLSMMNVMSNLCCVLIFCMYFRKVFFSWNRSSAMMSTSCWSFVLLLWICFCVMFSCVVMVLRSWIIGWLVKVLFFVNDSLFTSDGFFWSVNGASSGCSVCIVLVLVLKFMILIFLIFKWVMVCVRRIIDLRVMWL